MNRTGSKTRMADWPREQTCLVRRTVPRFHRSTFFGGQRGGLCHAGPRSLTGIAPWPPVSGARSLNHWITKEVLPQINFSSKFCLHSDYPLPSTRLLFQHGGSSPPLSLWYLLLGDHPSLLGLEHCPQGPHECVPSPRSSVAQGKKRLDTPD